METKRMAGPYEITHAIHIGDREIVLGENPAPRGCSVPGEPPQGLPSF